MAEQQPHWMSPEKREEWAEALRQRGLDACPECGARARFVAEGYVTLILNPEATAPRFDDRTHLLPTVAVICEQCGHVSQHLMGALGVQP